MKRWMLVLMLMLLGSPAFSQEAPAAPGSLASRSGYLSVGIDAGFMIDPDMVSGMVSLDYFITDDIAVGPYFHIGGAGRNKYWGVAGQVKYSAALANNSSVRPYGFMGIGFVELDFEDREDDPEMTYLFPVGGGFEFELTDIVSLEAGGVFEITEDTFGGLMVGCRFLL